MAEMPTDPDQPVDVNVLAASIDRLAKGFEKVAKSNEELAQRFDSERSWRRIVTAALAFAIAIALVAAVAAAVVAIQVRNQQKSEATESCLRSQVFRNDLYDGFEVYGKVYGVAIAKAVPDIPEAQAILDMAAERATDAVTETIPQRDCDG